MNNTLRFLFGSNIDTFESVLSKKRINRPWLPDHKPFESGRVGQRWDGYKTQRWRKFSIWYKTLHHRCIIDGCNRDTYYTDHITPVVELVRLGRDPYDPAECQPLCRLHGDIKTGSEGAKKRKG